MGQDGERCEGLITPEEVTDQWLTAKRESHWDLMVYHTRYYKSMTDLFEHLLTEVYMNWLQNVFFPRFVPLGVELWSERTHTRRL